MSKPTPAGYRPSGSQCAQCQRAAEDCSALDFAAMHPAGKRDADGVQRVACSFYERASADIPTLDEIKAAQGPLIAAIKSGWRKPCRCGPDMCADSVSCPRHNRTDG
jgi:hypothetical protein